MGRACAGFRGLGALGSSGFFWGGGGKLKPPRPPAGKPEDLQAGQRRTPSTWTCIPILSPLNPKPRNPKLQIPTILAKDRKTCAFCRLCLQVVCPSATMPSHPCACISYKCLKVFCLRPDPQPSTLNPQPSTLNPQPSTLNPQP